MLDRRLPLRRGVSSTASENCFLCAGVIWPGEETSTLHAVPVHGRCFDRDVRPELEPDDTAMH
jgi:hypothetical protein